MVLVIVSHGVPDYTPVFLSDIPRLFDSGQLPLDVALIHVSPPDEQGLCSFCVSVDIVKSATENASLVIAQVNPNMPRTLGDSFIHVYDIDGEHGRRALRIVLSHPESVWHRGYPSSCFRSSICELIYSVPALAQALRGWLTGVGARRVA